MTLTFSNLSADSFEAHLKTGRKRPRVREAVSCWQCRTRKTRCDRESPCGQCKHRGVPSDCVYSTPKDRQTVPRSRSRVKKPSPATSPRPSPSPPTQTHTPPESCPSREESPELSPISKLTAQQPDVPPTLPPIRATVFEGTARKTRMVGLSHWLAPCNEMVVLKGMLDHSTEFHPSRKAFAELKTQLRAVNTLPPALAQVGTDSSLLRLLLPERQECDGWVQRYFATYGRIHTILDRPAFIRDIDGIYAGTLTHPVHVSKVLLAVAIAMQNSEQDRLRGRRLAQAVEACVHTSLFQKPCVGVAQVLLLLVVIKTISASDTAKMYDIMSLMGLTSQVISSMGLHRDPALFAEVTPYYAEVRKRLWACYVRLNLDYCIRSGTQFIIRLEESDCPLPTSISLRTLDPISSGVVDEALQKQAEKDNAFAIAAAKLARILGPIQQGLYSPIPPASAEVQSRLRTGFKTLLDELPPALKPSANPTDGIETLQQSLISISMNSFLSIASLGATLGTPAEAAQRSQLMELWDNGTSVLHQFERLCGLPEVKEMTCQFLWTDAARSAMSCCWILGRLRQLDNSRILSHPQQTGYIFRNFLIESLGFLSALWQTRYHLGVVAAKLAMLLAVSYNVTSNLYTTENGVELDAATFRRKLFEDAAAAAERLIAEMGYGLLQQQQQQQQGQQALSLPPPVLVTMHPDSPGLASMTTRDSGSFPAVTTWAPSPSSTSGMGMLGVPVISGPGSDIGSISGASTPLLGHDFLALDFPTDVSFSGPLFGGANDFGFSMGDVMYQGSALSPYTDSGMVSMW
ncbi:fungal-specific transcription factor domain-containing protein [Cladorrhinum sp. PSN259]|nr:fungal-specific transcription factor domain-containing protein [Cladorrhinum sp. PSN259]